MCEFSALSRDLPVYLCKRFVIWHSFRGGAGGRHEAHKSDLVPFNRTFHRHLSAGYEPVEAT